MLGPSFAHADAYPTRVRLPAEPLMLCDRMMSVEGEPHSLGSGRLVTEHDVRDGAWYLDGGRAPVCISVEAGQADLFLSGWLGIDAETKGLRVYRLLDAQVVFHRDLPRPGEVLRYDIRIDRFIRQGDTWLFFFRFDGTADGEPLLTMRDGCAGFFSQEQLDGGRGIVKVRTEAPTARRPGTTPLAPLVPASRCTLDEAQVDALRDGDLARAFGEAFRGRTLPAPLRLPSGRMRLVHRITELDPAGGRWGLGTVTGEADVRPDDWYLTCHFSDDPVMPGTLMYECCLHTLRVLLFRLGFTAPEGVDAHFAPIVGAASRLRCRGQVVPGTKVASYRIDVREIGFDPEPYVLADASMYADGRHVVEMEGMSLRLAGVDRAALEALWAASPPAPPPAPAAPLFEKAHVLAFAEGNPSDAFGPRYAPFDRERRMARLPRPPYSFVDRILSTDAAAFELRAGTGVEAECDVPAGAWWLLASRRPSMPYAALLEAALQPCGWLAAYGGAALLSDEDLFFRNLEGEATLERELVPHAGPIRQRAKLTSAAQAGGMILVAYEMELWQAGRRAFHGTTRFGFFPAAALAAQVGIRGATRLEPSRRGRKLPWKRLAPATPEGATCADAPALLARAPSLLGPPAAAWSMLDEVVLHDGDGPRGLGLVRGSLAVDPSTWFFRAHFHQDPVMPGSLGCEAFLQLLEAFAADRFPHLAPTHRFEPIALGRKHAWTYRGQVLPGARRVEVDAAIVAVEDGPSPVVVADGHLAVDGLVIYQLAGFALRLVPRETE